jgi:hypothetical protein
MRAAQILLNCFQKNFKRWAYPALHQQRVFVSRSSLGLFADARLRSYTRSVCGGAARSPKPAGRNPHDRR